MDVSPSTARLCLGLLQDFRIPATHPHVQELAHDCNLARLELEAIAAAAPAVPDPPADAGEPSSNGTAPEPATAGS